MVGVEGTAEVQERDEMGKSIKALGAVLPNLGNEVEYFGPPTGERPGADKLSHLNPDKGQRVTRPADKIKAHFPRIHAAPFGVKGPLAPRKVVGRLEAVQAAIECGYGKRGEWGPNLAFDRTSCLRLSRYMLARLELVAACVSRDMSQAYRPREFSRVLEKSETGLLASIIGSMGTYLAGRQWLDAGGAPMASFLHYDIWSKARVTVQEAPETGSRPDFLVVDVANNWHVFESKGGRAQNRWARLAEGLQQLGAVKKVGWAHDHLREPTSKACVHTSIDAGRALKVTLVDPVDSSGLGDEQTNYRVVEPMARFMVALDTIDLFQAMTGTTNLAEILHSGDWTTRDTEAFGGLRLQMPTRILREANRMRRYVNLLLWFGAYINKQRKIGLSPDTSGLAGEVISSLMNQEPQAVRNGARRWFLEAQQVLTAIARTDKESLFGLSSLLDTRWSTEMVGLLRDFSRGDAGSAEMLTTTGELRMSALRRGPSFGDVLKV